MFVACWPVQRTKVGLMPFSVGAQPLYLLASTIEDLKFTLFFFLAEQMQTSRLQRKTHRFQCVALGSGSHLLEAFHN